MKKTIKFIKDGSFFRKLWGRIMVIIQHIIYFFLAPFFNVENDKIMFFTSRGTYNCNPSFIADELIRRKNCKIIWAYRDDDNENQFPVEIKLVKIDSAEFFREAASSKIWIDNSTTSAYRFPYKKKKQVLIQTWHGSIGLKRFDTNPDKRWISKIRKSAKWTDYLISNSSFESNLYRNTYWKCNEILLYGHPRNDVFFNSDIAKNRMDKVIRILNPDLSFKYCMYAPTYRDDNDFRYTIANLKKLVSVLAKKFGGQWKIMYRTHFLSMKEEPIFDPDIINVSDYPDIQDLLLFCNAGITDYSSWICDFMLTERPGFLYCPDYDSFEQNRGLLFPLQTTPFPVALNEQELYDNISNFDEVRFITECRKFIIDKGCIDDGFASSRIADKIDLLIKQD